MDIRQPHLWHWPEIFVAFAGLVGVVANVTLALGPLWLKIAIIAAYVLFAASAIAVMEVRSRRMARDADKRQKDLIDSVAKDVVAGVADLLERERQAKEGAVPLTGMQDAVAALVGKALQRQAAESHFRLGWKARGDPPPKKDR